MKHLESKSLFSALLILLQLQLQAQPFIGEQVRYGQVHEQTGLLFIRTTDAFYSIDSYSEQYTKIDIGDVDEDKIYQPPGTPYLFVYGPDLNIIDLVDNKPVFQQKKAGFDQIMHVDVVSQLDAFFMVGTESSETDYLLQNKTISFYLIDILSGETIWKYTPDEDQGKLFKPTTQKPMVISNNRVVFPFGGNLYCLDSQLGTFIWKIPFKEPSVIKSLVQSFTIINWLDLFATQQPSEYFLNGTDLIVFENYKLDKVRYKSVRAISQEGIEKWNRELTEGERIGDVWNNLLQISTAQSTKMINLETGKDAWDQPITTSDKYFYHFIHPNQEYLVTRENPKATAYPRTHNVYDLSTGKSIWKTPKHFPDKRRKVSVEKLGLTVYDKDDKELNYYAYESGEIVWSYPKKQMNDFRFINENYYVSKDTEIDKLTPKGEKKWISSPPIASKGIWRIIKDGKNEILISDKSNSKKNISIISETGEVIKSREWKMSSSDSLLFVRFSREKVNYITFSGIYQLDMSSDEKPETLAKFSGKDRAYQFNEDESQIIIRVGESYHFYDFNKLEYRLLGDKVGFEGNDERRIINFVGDSGISVQNQENIAYLNFQSGLVFNKYYKYPKTSEFLTGLLKRAVSIATTYIVLDQVAKLTGNEAAFWISGDQQFLKAAQIHNRNMVIVGMVGDKMVSKLNEMEQKRKARKSLARRSKPIAVFSEKRKIHNQRTTVIVQVDPTTGEELNVFDIGEKNPVYYVDSSGGTIFYINKANIVTRLRM